MELISRDLPIHALRPASQEHVSIQIPLGKTIVELLAEGRERGALERLEDLRVVWWWGGDGEEGEG
jgi:hypothetical protein